MVARLLIERLIKLKGGSRPVLSGEVGGLQQDICSKEMLRFHLQMFYTGCVCISEITVRLLCVYATQQLTHYLSTGDFPSAETPYRNPHAQIKVQARSFSLSLTHTQDPFTPASKGCDLSNRDLFPEFKRNLTQ